MGARLVVDALRSGARVLLHEFGRDHLEPAASFLLKASDRRGQSAKSGYASLARDAECHIKTNKPWKFPCPAQSTSILGGSRKSTGGIVYVVPVSVDLPDSPLEKLFGRVTLRQSLPAFECHVIFLAIMRLI